MSQQISGNNSSIPFAIGHSPIIREQETILQEATRSVVLKQFTAMCRATVTGKWTPITSASITATDGKAMSFGIYIGDDIPSATLVAGDTTGPILVADALYDNSQLVWGTGPTGVLGAQTLTTLVGGAAIASFSLQDLSEMRGLIPVSTQVIDAFEN